MMRPLIVVAGVAVSVFGAWNQNGGQQPRFPDIIQNMGGNQYGGGQNGGGQYPAKQPPSDGYHGQGDNGGWPGKQTSDGYGQPSSGYPAKQPGGDNGQYGKPPQTNYPGGQCQDKSTTASCWQATRGGQRDYCTNSNICPTCGDYMRQHCRYTCRNWIAGCDGAKPPAPAPTPSSGWKGQCYIENKYYESGNKLIRKCNKNSLKKCQKECKKQNGCVWVQWNRNSKRCEMLRGPVDYNMSHCKTKPGWTASTVDCGMEQNNGYGSAYRAILGDATTPVFVVAGLGAVFAVAGAAAMVVRNKKTSSAEYEPLSAA